MRDRKFPGRRATGASGARRYEKRRRYYADPAAGSNAHPRDLRFCGFIRSEECKSQDWAPLSRKALLRIRHVWSLQGLINAIARHEGERDYHYEYWCHYFTGRTRQQAIEQLWKAYVRWSLRHGGCPRRRPERRPRPKQPPPFSLPPPRPKRTKPSTWKVIDGGKPARWRVPPI